MRSNQTAVPPASVLACQRITFLEDDLLLEKLQQSDGLGLGPAVVAVKAYVSQDPSGTAQDSQNESSLEMVIIIAIVIACVAFVFLIFAIFWAWRYDKRNRHAFLAQGRKTDTEGTFDANDSPEPPTKERPKTLGAPVLLRTNPVMTYPSVIGGESDVEGGVYAESVISEDIHSSLSQYYAGGTSGNYNYTNGRLQDAASVSSMESYGYSLDGYTPSLNAPNHHHHHPTRTISLPTEPANTDSWKDTKDLRSRVDDVTSDWGVSTDYYAVRLATSPKAVNSTEDEDDDDDDTEPHPMDEKEMPPPPGAPGYYAGDDRSMMESTLGGEESAILTTVMDYR